MSRDANDPGCVKTHPLLWFCCCIGGADTFRAGDIVRFVGHEMSFIADHVVVRRDEALKSVWTVELFNVDLVDRIASAPGYDYSLARIEPLGNGFRILVGSEVVESGFATEAAAARWLKIRAPGDNVA